MRRTATLAFVLAAAFGCARDGIAPLSGAVATRVVASDRDASTLLAGEPGASGTARAARDGVSVVSDGRRHAITTEPATLLEWSPRGDSLAIGQSSRRRDGAGGPAVTRIEVWAVDEPASRRWSGAGNAFGWASDGSVLAFSPDGASLAVADERGLRVLAVAGSGSLSLVPEAEARDASIVPFWSPDGGRLGAAIYPLAGGPAHTAPGRIRVWEIAAPETPRDLGEIDNPWDFEPAFSPDGASIALVSSRHGRSVLTLRKNAAGDVPLADLGPADRSTGVRWVSPTVVRVEGGPRVVDVTLR